jgi:hypothetical protein
LSFGGAKMRFASSAYHLPAGKLRDRLPDDPDGLAHLLAADEVAVVASPSADRDVEFVLLVAAVGLVLAQVERHPGAAQVRAGQAVGDRVLLGDDADAAVRSMKILLRVSRLRVSSRIGRNWSQNASTRPVQPSGTSRATPPIRV